MLATTSARITPISSSVIRAYISDRFELQESYPGALPKTSDSYLQELKGVWGGKNDPSVPCH